MRGDPTRRRGDHCPSATIGATAIGATAGPHDDEPNKHEKQEREDDAGEGERHTRATEYGEHDEERSCGSDPSEDAPGKSSIHTPTLTVGRQRLASRHRPRHSRG